MTWLARVRGYAIWQAENLCRFSFCLGRLGHASVQATERYLRCKQKFSQAVDDNLGLKDT